MTNEWDGAGLRKDIERSILGAERYAREHAGRIRRGQPNGNEMMHDMSLGEAFACECLVVSIHTDTPTNLIKFIDERMESVGYVPNNCFDKDDFLNGYKMKLREFRKRAQNFLDERD